MKLVKYIVAGTLLIGLAFALNINIPSQLQTVPRGQVADYSITILNLDEGQNVMITATSEAPISMTEQTFFLEQFEEKTVHLLAVTNTLGESMYLITIDINGQVYNLALYVDEGSPVLRFDAITDTIEATQGETQSIKFLIRNEGKERMRNIVIEGDIPKGLSPEYPIVFDLAPNQMRQIEVNVSVPEDYPTDEYEVEVKAGSGNLVVEEDILIKIVGRESLEDKLVFDVLLPWEPVKEEENGNTIGYALTLRITNRGISDVSNVRFKFKGMPETWEITGDEDFNIEGYETKDIVLQIVPADFGEHEVNITLVRDAETITSQTILFAGYKVGTTTGMVIAGGDVFAGILVIVIIAVILLYVRQRSSDEEKKEEQETRAYLEDLVKKTREKDSKRYTKKRK